jgi:integrase
MVQTRAEHAVRDKSYRRYPIGQDVGHYLRALRVARRSPNTIESYETVLRLLALDHRDFASLERFAEADGVDLLVAFLDKYWGDSADATLEQRGRVLASYFGWALATGRVTRDPTVTLTLPKRRDTRRRAHALDEIRWIAHSQDSTRDESALLLFGRLGLRKNDVRELQIEDIDLAHDLVYIKRQKGGDRVELPLVFTDLRQALYLHLQERGGHPEEYLLYPRQDRRRPLSESALHRWFKRCLTRAGVADFPLHELRHSAGDYIWRESGNLVVAQQLLRHKSIETTRRYLHPTREDLIAAMRKADAN